jgi:hypothetical protein
LKHDAHGHLVKFPFPSVQTNRRRIRRRESVRPKLAAAGTFFSSLEVTVLKADFTARESDHAIRYPT